MSKSKSGRYRAKRRDELLHLRAVVASYRTQALLEKLLHRVLDAGTRSPEPRFRLLFPSSLYRSP